MLFYTYFAWTGRLWTTVMFVTAKIVIGLRVMEVGYGFWVMTTSYTIFQIEC